MGQWLKNQTSKQRRARRLKSDPMRVLKRQMHKALANGAGPNSLAAALKQGA